jgi:hypothetical protein
MSTDASWAMLRVLAAIVLAACSQRREHPYFDHEPEECGFPGVHWIASADDSGGGGFYQDRLGCPWWLCPTSEL